MSKLACGCRRNVISDTTDSLAFKALMLPDEDDEPFHEKLLDAVEQFLNGSEDRSKFNEFLSDLEIQYMRTVYECTACGRLYVESPENANEFFSFEPETGTYDGVLKRTRYRR